MGSRERDGRGRRGGVVGTVLLAAALVALPRLALAAHYVDEGNGCYGCHTLDANEAEPQTSFIATIARTLPLMKVFNGGTVPANFGCTFCHSNPGNATMRDVLGHFGTHASKHPLGRPIGGGADTNYEYLSAVGSSSSTELDCVDCHDPALLVPGPAYVGHAAPGVGARVQNPSMLRSVAVLDEYDPLCRSCHGSGVGSSANYKGTGVDIRLGVGARHGDASGGAQDIVEDDGTQLRTTAAGGNDQCRGCHDTHYSDKVRLFNDGHEGDTAIVSANCTAVCHYAGDANNGYLNHGHGKAQSTYKYRAGVSDYSAGSFYVTMGMGCTACHEIIDTSDTSGSRKPHVEQPTGGTVQQNYKARFNLSINLQSWDNVGSSFGNPVAGVCYQCHAAYTSHVGDAANTTSGCQDCHDEHAEGSGVGSNQFMIPQTAKPSGNFVAPIKTRAGTEAVTYDSTRLNPASGAVYGDGSIDLYRADGAGACDNLECHGPPNGSTGDLATLMDGATGTHTGGVPQNPGTGCLPCHPHHGDPAGSWRAASSCSNSVAGCHGTDAANAYPDGSPGVYPDRGGKHAGHIARIAAVTGLGAGGTTTCGFCHPGGSHSGDQSAAPADMNDGTAGKQFRTINNLVDANGAATAASCSNIDCHYNTTVTIADWYGAPPMSCAYCHADGVAAYTPGQLPKAHDRHVDEVAGGGYDLACTNCHPNYASNWSHQDGDVAGDVLFTVTAPPWGNDGDESVSGGNGLVKYGGGVVGDYYTCNGVSCHGDYDGGNNGSGGTTTNAPNWFNTGGAGDGRCGTCHGTTTGPDPMPNYTDGAPKANKHPKHTADSGYGCQECHYSVTTDGTTVASLTLHVNGAYNLQQAAGAPALKQFSYLAGSCSTTNCHGGNTVAWSAGTQTCDVCHGELAGSPTNTDVNDFAWDGTTQSKVSASEYVADGGGHGDNTGGNAPNKACADCHDSAVAHDTTAGLTGANPFRLVDQDGGTGGLQYTCSYNGAGCHTAGTIGPETGLDISTFVTHSDEAMLSAGGYTAIRTWPAWNPRCTECHDPHGDGAPNLSMVQRELYDKGSSVAGVNTGSEEWGVPAAPDNTALVFTDNATGADATGNSYADLDSPFSSVCQECHEHASVVSFHDGPAGGTAAGANHVSTGGNPGDCSACHRHSEAFKPSGCANSVAGCHGTDSANSQPDGAVYPDRAGKHSAHIARIAAVNTLSTTNESTCVWCHPNPGGNRTGTGETGHNDNVQPADLHGDGRAGAAVTHFADIAGTADTGDSVTINVSCNNVNCHYNTTVTIADWYGAPAFTCATCHAWQPYAAGSLPKAHDRHVDEVADGGYNMNGSTFGCFYCHPNTVANSHQNGAVDISFAALPWGNDADEGVSGGGATPGAVKYGGGVVGDYYTCNGISCHGDYDGGNNGLGGTTTNAPNWFNTGGAGDGRCGTCHGTTTGPDPMPNNTDGTPKANKHPKHVTDSGYGCQECHYSVTTDGSTVASLTLHANGTFNLQPAGGAPALKQFGWTAPDCTTVNCHGGNTVAWSAGTQTCDICHGELAGSPTNTDVNDFAWDGTTQSKVSASEYTADGGGHGDNTGGNAPNKACADCHDSAVAHDTTAGLTGTNPFRLVDQDGGTGGLQYTCSYNAAGCHAAGTIGPATGRDISTFVTHSDEAMATAGYTTIRTWPAWNPRCTECHDPHGDGAPNLSMVQRELYDKGSSVAGVNTGDEEWGVPAAPDNTALVFTDDTTGADTTGNSYADTNSPFSSVCQECHEDAGMVSFRDGATAAGVNHTGTGGNPGDCSACHRHNEAFKPAGCDNSAAGCHGTDGANSQPDGAVYPDRAGKHAEHITAIAAVNSLATTDESTCGWCHPNPGTSRAGTGEAGHNDNVQPADLHGDGRAGATVTHFNDIAGTADTGDSVTISTSCNNVNCHYNTTVTIANWYGSPALSCAFCHADGVAAYTPGQLPKAHDRHVDEVAGGGYNLACTNCHPDHGSTWAHQDGDVAGEVLFTVTAPPWGNDGDESVSGGNGLVKYGGGVVGDYYTCNGVSCHGDYDGGNNGSGGTTTNAPNWFNTGGSGDGRCGTCHGTTTGPDPMPNNTDGTPKANKHPKHVSENGYGCQECHYSVTTDGTTVASLTLHVNGAYDLQQAAGAPALKQFGWTAPNCTAVNCHGGNTVAWSAGTQTCDVCHGEAGGVATNTDVNNFAWDGTTQSKVSASEYSGRGHGAKSAVCADCHDSAVAHDTSGTLNGGNPFRLAAGFSCTSAASACHDGTPTASVATVRNHTSGDMTAAGYAPQVNTWSFAPSCVSCHDPHGDGSNLRMIQRELYESAFGLPAGPPPAVPTEQTNLSFTDEGTGADATGNSYAKTTASYDSLCQACHESGDADFTSFKDGVTPISTAPHPSPGSNPGDCSSCHQHSSAFAPSACEGCHDGSVALAPNVIDGALPNNGALSYNWYGSGAGQDGGHGDAGGQAAVECTDCHDTSQPPGNFHLNGTYESIWDNTTRNANTAHLKAEFFTRSAPPAVPVGSGAWDVQVYFDNYCAYQCHTGVSVADMRHEQDTAATDNNHWSVQFGTHLTTSNGDTTVVPVDVDLNTGAAGGADYAPCIACHDPHGTTVNEPSKTSNRMVREQWLTPSAILCGYCHI